ncbi:uncharacterized protein HKW66_Vig0004050 [Vigna angularis]|uniref:Uncharacterized protein n=1 Tax=Phaseolus angularis TaxID=3914 RepID=A0A8T0LAB9_PHAAN|nr:uncharacterized protein HKW66_Vig0004050 [Vigna angularis]
MDLLTFFQNALHNPTLLQPITRKIESMDLLVYNKKRRLPPRLDDRDHVAGNTFVECFGTEFGNVSHHEFFEAAKTFYALFERSKKEASASESKPLKPSTHYSNLSRHNLRSSNYGNRNVQRGHDSFDVTTDLHNRSKLSFVDRLLLSVFVGSDLDARFLDLDLVANIANARCFDTKGSMSAHKVNAYVADEDEGHGTMTRPASVLGFGPGLRERRSSRWWKGSGFAGKFGLRRRGRRGRWSRARGAF